MRKKFSERYKFKEPRETFQINYTEEEIKSSFAEAKYMLVTCSAFVNYLIEKKKET